MKIIGDFSGNILLPRRVWSGRKVSKSEELQGTPASLFFQALAVLVQALSQLRDDFRGGFDDLV
jgi:hypothetical protein